MFWWCRGRASCPPRFFGFNYDPGARKEARGATQRQKRQAGIARYQGGERPREAQHIRRPALTATSPAFFSDVGGSLLTQRRTDGAPPAGLHAERPIARGPRSAHCARPSIDAAPIARATHLTHAPRHFTRTASESRRPFSWPLPHILHCNVLSRNVSWTMDRSGGSTAIP